MSHLRILRAGMLTTVQDLGRWGFQASGVPVAGPMDEYSHRAANVLVGNDPNAAVLEITLVGPELEVLDDRTCAVCGAEFRVIAGDRDVACHEPFLLRAGVPLRFATRRAGARATFAVRGGIDVAPMFGSRATSLFARMGGVEGRALRGGDFLPLGAAADRISSPATPRRLPMPSGGALLRVIAGPHDHLFTPSARRTFFESRFTITPVSNRMGYRLEGPPLTHTAGAGILSDPTPVGSIQVPASGQPILLMADRQTTGGYPKIATVISADLPLAGQLAPGDWIEFRACTRDQAVEANRRRRRHLEGVADE